LVANKTNKKGARTETCLWGRLCPGVLKPSPLKALAR